MEEGCILDHSVPVEAGLREETVHLILPDLVPKIKIKNIDTQLVKSMPGVFAVWTHQNVAELPPINFRPTKYKGLKPYRQPILPDTNVRYVGEPLAVVFAENAYIAEDGANLLDIEIEVA